MNTALIVFHLYQTELLLLCYILVAPYWGWNYTDKMTHANYYIDVGLLRVS